MKAYNGLVRSNDRRYNHCRYIYKVDDDILPGDQVAASQSQRGFHLGEA